MISLNSHYVDTAYLIGLSFETFVSDYHINVQVQENLHYLLNLGIKDGRGQGVVKIRDEKILT